MRKRGNKPLTDGSTGLEFDDARLVAAVALRDASAFRSLVGRHAPALYRVAYRMLGDAVEAEDVVQESLLRLWDGAAAWHARGGGLPAWLRRVATNLCIDRKRRTARIADVPVPDLPDASPSSDAAIDAARAATAVRAALQALPDRQRAAVVLTYYEELPNAEAAAVLGLGLKAFESLLLRGRAALRAQLGEPGDVAGRVEGSA